MLGEKNSNYRTGVASTHKLEGNSWRAMRQRCDDPKYWAYNHYGGRGIKYCERWKSFANFFADMGPKPTPKHSLDRIDNNGDYCPENCRWADQKTQVANSSKKLNALVTSEQIEASGINPNTVRDRLYRGWSVKEALTRPVEKHYRQRG